VQGQPRDFTLQGKKWNGRSLLWLAPSAALSIEEWSMQPLKVAAGRRPRHATHVRGYGLHHCRAAVRKNDRCYVDHGRLSRPRGAVAGKRSPYVELAVTVAAFLFVLFIVCGGASPPEPEVASMGTERPR
jgi:hypothetical protein